ncbi:hypothetical protein JMJ35_004776 [Cladonia borealis]|uniref:Uncharacterized protein n=1 Tax=Cladonia borealis TaxID=184061 RepID=A0AA39V5M9_9LECA|nr:hypothetical protein JMJ35_004776 [Cladonia borealis]
MPMPELFGLSTLLNKYCVYRAMLILHTALFALQTDDLDEQNLGATWAILHRIKTPQMIIYNNCSVEAGSSQGHKHIPIFPRQDSEVFQPFPSKALSTEGITDDIEGVPFKHFVIRLPTGVPSDYVFQQYRRLLNATKSALRDANAGGDYNLVLVRECLALTPRRCKGYGEDFIANAASMVGMMWMTSEEQRDKLLKLDLPGLSGTLGIPLQGALVGIEKPH